MKKVYILSALVLSVLFASCNAGANAKTDANEEGGASATELVEAAAAGGAYAVISAPIHLTTADFNKLVVDFEASNDWNYLGDKPAIIDFWADWCPPCRIIAPILDELAEEYAGQIYVYKVDVDSEKQIASVFNIQSIPTLLFIPSKGDPRAEVGAIPKEQFKDRIDNFLLASE